MELGILSKNYESSGDCGAINTHDDAKGGMSYGLYQFYSGANIVQDFITWLSNPTNYYNSMGIQFNNLIVCTTDFNTKWKQIALNNQTEFSDAQYQYAKLMYFDKAIEQLSKIGYTTNSNAMQNIIWSCAIQYSPYKVSTIFNEAAQWIGFTDCTKIIDNRLFLSSIYYIRSTDKWNKSYRKMCYRMFLEAHDAIDMLTKETLN